MSSEGVRKLISELDRIFSGKVRWDSHQEQWPNVIFLKAQELSNHLCGERKRFDLSSPSPELVRVDSAEMRERILNTSYAEWVKNGGSKGTLHYMKKKAREDGRYKIYRKNAILSR